MTHNDMTSVTIIIVISDQCIYSFALFISNISEPKPKVKSLKKCWHFIYSYYKFIKLKCVPH